MLAKLSDIGFDKAYCVSLKHKDVRRAHAKREFAKIGIAVDFWDAVEGRRIDHKQHSLQHTAGMVGCFLSHHNIYKHALENGYEKILVLEDDLKPMAGFSVFMKMALKNLPDDWEFIYLGFTHYDGLHAYQKKVNDFFVIPGFGWGTQAYMVKGRKTIEHLYNNTKQMVKQIDEQLCQLILPNQVKYYMVFPPAILQEGMGSDCQTHRK
jgi:GR25 family glycosyltransferase involved in LPS biosynthesis